MYTGEDSPMMLDLRICLLGLLALRSIVAAQAVNWELAHPDAMVVAGMNLGQIRGSAVAKSIGEQITAQMTQAMAIAQAMAPQGNPIMTKAGKLPVAEILNDIDSIFVSSPADLSAVGPASPAGRNTGATKQSPFLIVVKGTFPDDHIRPLLEGKHPNYKGINIYGGSGPNDGSIALLDENTVLFGDADSVRGAIDRRGTKPLLNPIARRAQELAAASDIWAVVTASGAKQTAAGRNSANPMASEIEGLELAIQMRQGLVMDVGLQMKTEATANMMASLLSSQLQAASAQATAQKGNDSQVAEMMRKLHVAAEGKRMTLHVALTAQEVQESIRLAQAVRMGAVPGSAQPPGSGVALTSGASPSQISPPQAEPTPAGPRKVRIYGLDDGVKEITLDPPNR